MTQISGPNYHEGQYLLRNGEHGRLEELARKARNAVYELRKTCKHPESHLSVRHLVYYPNFFAEHSLEFHCYQCDQEWKFLFESGIDKLSRMHKDGKLPAGYIQVKRELLKVVK